MQESFQVYATGNNVSSIGGIINITIHDPLRESDLRTECICQLKWGSKLIEVQVHKYTWVAQNTFKLPPVHYIYVHVIDVHLCDIMSQ